MTKTFWNDKLIKDRKTEYLYRFLDLEGKFLICNKKQRFSGVQNRECLIKPRKTLLIQKKLLAFLREKMPILLILPLFLGNFLYFAGFIPKNEAIYYGQAGIISSFTKFIQKNISEIVSNSASATGSSNFSYINDAISIQEDNFGEDAVLDEENSSEIITVQNDSLAAPLNSFSEELARDKIVIYEVKSGDTPSDIAKYFNISVNTLLWANDLGNPNLIKIGDKLIILPISGIKYIVKKGDTVMYLAKKYKGDVADIISFNGLPSDGTLQEGQEIIVPDGTMPVAPSARSFFTKNSKAVSVKSKYASLPNLSDYFIMPVLWDNSGIGALTHYSQGLHGKNGVDIANKACGKVPIYAAADGVVLIADGYGYNGGFGKYIVIDHPNGTQTLYAHHSRLLVSSGQYVKQGQEIGYMGSTGRSTGCHLHFEVHGARNPFLKY